MYGVETLVSTRGPRLKSLALTIPLQRDNPEEFTHSAYSRTV